MTEKRLWTQEEDRLLKCVFDATRMAKWTHIALVLQQEHGIKNINGKQCKERYTTHIDINHPKDEWSFDDEQSLLDLHNQLGNKWAVIGEKLGNRSDNCVKNHFYTKLRKTLRKINKVIGRYCPQEIREIKPNVLYRIVEASQQKFKLVPCFEKTFSLFANELKNELLSFQYEEGMIQDESGERIARVIDSVKNIANSVSEFELNYKKKGKKQRRGSLEQNKMVALNICQMNKKCISEDNDIDQNSLIISSEMISNLQYMSDQEQNRATNNKNKRRNSQQCEKDSMIFENIRKRTRSQTKSTIDLSIENMEALQDEKQGYNMQNLNCCRHQESLKFENNLSTMQILEQEQQLPLIMLMKNHASTYPDLSEDMEQEDYGFFQESRIQMGMLPEIQLNFHRDSHVEENLFS